MKRTLIIAGSIIGVVLITLVCASIFGPTIARNYIQKHSKELIGRQIWIDDLKMNFFTGSVSVNGFKMMEQNSKDVFTSFDSLDVSIKLRSLISKKLFVRSISVSAPHVRILQNGSKFNFSDLLDRPKDTTQADTSKSSFTFVINNISIKKGSLLYKDIPMNSVWDMRKLDLNIPGVYFGGQNTNVGLAFNFASGGFFKSTSDYNVKTGKYMLNISLKDLDVKGALPYLQQYLKVNSFAGFLSSDVIITGDANHIMDLVVKGGASIRNMAITDNANSKVLGVNLATIKFNEINLKSKNFLLESIKIAGGDILFTLLKDGNNLTKMMVPSKPGSSSDASAKKDDGKMNFSIQNVEVSSVNVNFSDRTLRRPFSYKLTDISIASKNVRLEGTNNATLKAVLPGGGKAVVEWSGELGSIANQNLSVDVKNLALKYFSPYVEEYTAYPLTKGVLSFGSINHIKNFKIAAQNKLEAYEVEAGNKSKEFKPAVKIPLKTALYIIKDKDDKIKFDVPVAGMVNSPEFSYRKIIFKTIVNLLVKVAVAPVNFIGKGLGLKSDLPESIAFDPVQVDLNTQQNALLGDLATILNSKQKLALTFTPAIDSMSIKQQVAFENARKAFFIKSNNLKDSTLTLEQVDLMKKVKIDNAQFVAYVDSLVPSELPIAQKMMSIYQNDFLNAAISGLMKKQQKSIFDFLTIQQGITPARVKFTSSKLSDKQSVKEGKNVYYITLGIEGEDLSADEVK